MYLGKKEHNPPHIHAYYQKQKATYDIKTGEKMEGKIPPDKEKLVSAWIIVHKDELVSVHKVGYFMDRTLHLLPFRTETVRKMRF
jgi:hypothetical protein